MEAVVRDENHMKEVLAAIRDICRHEVKVGLFASKVSEKTLIAARVNEFGAAIKKTPRMTRFLAAMARKYGIKLDPAKAKRPGYVVIPPRSFIRSAADRERNALARIAERMLDGVIQGRFKPRDALEAMGLKLEQAIKDQINRVSSPPLHPLTIAMKGSDKPLVKSGDMRKAVTYKVVPRSR